MVEKGMAEPSCIEWPDPCRVLLSLVSFFLSERRGCGHNWCCSELGECFPAAAAGLQIFPWKAVLGAVCIFFDKS